MKEMIENMNVAILVTSCLAGAASLILVQSMILSLGIMFFCSIGFCISLYRIFKDHKLKVMKLRAATKIKASMLKEKNELVEIFSYGVEIAVAILTKENTFKWGNKRLLELFNVKHLDDKSNFDEFIFDRLISVEKSSGMRGAVQIKGVQDSDFILRRCVDHKSGNTIYSFYPVKLYFKEYIKGQKHDSLYEELGDNIFELFSIVDEACCSVGSQFDEVKFTSPEGRLPVLVRGSEEAFSNGLQTLVKAAFYLSAKLSTKQVQMHYCKNNDAHTLSFRIPELAITSSVLEEKFTNTNNGQNLSDIFRKVEKDLKAFGADLIVKNIEMISEKPFASIELNFSSISKPEVKPLGGRVDI